MLFIGLVSEARLVAWCALAVSLTLSVFPLICQARKRVWGGRPAFCIQCPDR